MKIYNSIQLNTQLIMTSVVLIGCGAPLKSMGWYHAVQILNKGCNIDASLGMFICDMVLQFN